MIYRWDKSFKKEVLFNRQVLWSYSTDMGKFSARNFLSHRMTPCTKHGQGEGCLAISACLVSKGEFKEDMAEKARGGSEAII